MSDERRVADKAGIMDAAAAKLLARFIAGSTSQSSDVDPVARSCAAVARSATVPAGWRYQPGSA